MGSGFSSSRPSSAESGWGDVEERDEDLYQPVKNYEGETVGWKERSESDKIRRKRANEDFMIVEEDENDSFVKDLEVIEDKVSTEEEEFESEEEEPFEKVKQIPLIIEEAPNEESEDGYESEHERVPSGKSINLTAVSHRERVTDKFRPSLKPNENFNKESAAAKLYKALKSLDTDEEMIIFIMSTHSAKQRNKIEKTYKYNHRRVRKVLGLTFLQVIFVQNLTHDLKNKLHSHFETLCIGLIQDEAEFCVESLRKLVEGRCRCL